MEIKDRLKVYFRTTLLAWHQSQNHRNLPWVGISDPYRIWLSEVILQQTRVDQALPYYTRFATAFPSIHDLADAPEDLVFRMWQGLGYYSRCRNLIRTAKHISRRLNGRFPSDYASILALEGVGPYTAAAVASFAFGLPHAVLDGNVYRVLARFFDVDEPIDGSSGRKFFQQLASELLDSDDPASYNQAIMDFGATVCTPRDPDCAVCPLTAQCRGRKQQTALLLPVKARKLRVRTRTFHYFYLHCGDRAFIRQRNDGDIWPNLYELYGVEQETPDWQALPFPVSGHREVRYEGRQRLTHQLIQSYFYVTPLAKKPNRLAGGLWIAQSHLNDYAFPKTILSFLRKMHYI